MGSPLDALQTALDAATVAVFGYVGWRLTRRKVEGNARLANQLFSAWWILLAGFTAIIIFQRIAAMAGIADLAFYLTVMEIELLVLCVALWALLYYLVYVLTGSRKAMVPITIFYASFYVWLLFIVSARHPTAVELDGPRANLTFANGADPVVLGAFAILLIGPVLVAAAGYFRLFFRVEERTQRYRIGLVAVTLLGWFGSSAIASIAQLSRFTWWPAASSIVGLMAAICIYFAYQPPRFVRERWGIRAVGEETLS